MSILREYAVKIVCHLSENNIEAGEAQEKRDFKFGIINVIVKKVEMKIDKHTGSMLIYIPTVCLTDNCLKGIVLSKADGEVHVSWRATKTRRKP